MSNRHLYIMIICVGSGGYFNPVITLGFTLARVLSIPQAICYFFAQIIGGIVGAALVRVCIPFTVHFLKYILPSFRA